MAPTIHNHLAFPQRHVATSSNGLPVSQGYFLVADLGAVVFFIAGADLLFCFLLVPTAPFLQDDLKEFDGEYDIDELRLMRIKFISEVAN